MTVSTIVWIVIAAVAGAALCWTAILAATRATRLDRLNVRVDLARESLVAALERRAVVCRAIAAAGPDTPETRALIEAANAAESAEIAEREAVENSLAVALARVDDAGRSAALTAELADAQVRVRMARRFYNDAVRDARALGERRLVRWLHLAGHAKLPEYFEITERVAGPR